MCLRRKPSKHGEVSVTYIHKTKVPLRFLPSSSGRRWFGSQTNEGSVLPQAVGFSRGESG